MSKKIIVWFMMAIGLLFVARGARAVVVVPPPSLVTFTVNESSHTVNIVAWPQRLFDIQTTISQPGLTTIGSTLWFAGFSNTLYSLVNASGIDYYLYNIYDSSGQLIHTLSMRFSRCQMHPDTLDRVTVILQSDSIDGGDLVPYPGNIPGGDIVVIENITENGTAQAVNAGIVKVIFQP